MSAKVSTRPGAAGEHNGAAREPFFVRIGSRKKIGYHIVHGACWLWTGSCDAAGYGQAFSRRRGTVTKAHRVIWEFCRGPIPAGLELDHLCRVRNCVNPDHLELVTHTENQRRVRRTHCRRGHPYTPATTYVYVKKSGWVSRVCLVCKRMGAKS